mmetsp:Transcript_36353/g.86937  ORF Transcript_36353/g.86937 Transcript_36353/m.86937 type:complete len:129 (-) Transcript_36353:120-506(-)
MNDPEKKDVNFLVGFLDFLGQNGNMDQPVVPANGGFFNFRSAPVSAAGMPPAKRQRTDGSNGMMALPPPTSEPGKDALVQRIKTYQRSGEDAKQGWWAHCDQLLGGVRDPARHDLDMLQQFVESYGVP